MSEQIQIYRDGELDTELMPQPPTIVEAAVGSVKAAISHVAGEVALQTRMAAFDFRHGTNYRTIRNELVEQKRRHEFEKRIGLVAIDRK